jgi:hypothetical protein
LEWWYWYERLHNAAWELAVPKSQLRLARFSPDGKTLLVDDPATGWVIYSFPS